MGVGWGLDSQFCEKRCERFRSKKLTPLLVGHRSLEQITENIAIVIGHRVDQLGEHHRHQIDASLPDFSSLMPLDHGQVIVLHRLGSERTHHGRQPVLKRSATTHAGSLTEFLQLFEE